MDLFQPVVRRLERWIPPEMRREAYSRRRALLAVGVAAFIAVMCLVTTPPIVLALGSPNGLVAGVNTLLVAVLSGATLVFVRRTGSLVLAGNWLAMLLFVGIAYSLLNGGGLTAPFLCGMLMCPVLALVVAGRRSGYLWIGICVGLIVSMYVAQRSGVTFANEMPASAYVDVIAIMYVAVLILLTMIAAFSESTTEIALVDVELATRRLGSAQLAEERLRLEAERARAENDAKSAFLARMSHELRTPLNAIIGFSELLAEEAESGSLSSGELLADLRNINVSGQHLLEIISNILDLTNIETSQVHMSLKPCLVAPLVEEVVDAFRPLAEAKGTTIESTCASEAAREPGGLRAMADETRLRQVLMNLTSNAVKFTPRGRVTLRCYEAEEGEWVALEVEDTGIGIPADKIDAVFTAFDQVDTSTTRRHDGAGLGLTISRQLVEMMGGRVELSSREGEGSRLTVLLHRVA